MLDKLKYVQLSHCYMRLVRNASEGLKRYEFSALDQILAKWIQDRSVMCSENHRT
jgi:hypothetical protein